MNKLRFELVDKIINDSELTSLEFDFLIQAAKRSDAYGSVRGLYYGEFANELNCHASSFYNLLDSLELRGYIHVQKNHNTDIDIFLLHNNFNNPFTDQIEYKNYINLGINLFWDSAFYEKRAGAKRLMLYLVKRVLAAGANDIKKLNSNRDYYSLNKLFFNRFTENREIAKMLGVQVRMIRDYYQELTDWLSFESGVNLGNKVSDVVTIKRKSALNGGDALRSNKETSKFKKHGDYPYHLHYIRTFCRRFKITGDNGDLEDVADLINQYQRKAVKVGKDIFNLVTSSIQLACDRQSIDGRTVHKILTNMLMPSAL